MGEFDVWAARPLFLRVFDGIYFRALRFGEGGVRLRTNN
jgi:hypothetical protein